MTVPLYNWPIEVMPSAAIVLATSNTIDGFISRASMENDRPVPGARGQMRMDFDTQLYGHGHLYSWLVNNARRAYWRVPVWNTPQLATSPAIEAAAAQYAQGIPFSSGVPFLGGAGFLFDPTLDVKAGALEGENEIVIDETRWPDALTYGKVFGIGTAVYHVDEMDRVGADVWVKFSPPLRKNVSTGDAVSLRPKMICKPKDVNNFVALFQASQLVTPGSIVMNEVIDEEYV